MTDFYPPCDECGGKCCDYVAIETSRPKNKADYDHMRWYLAHENVHIFVDHEKKWYVQFVTPCSMKNDNNRCNIYPERPKICSGHGNIKGECEYFASPYREYFTSISEFEIYLRKKNIVWRYKSKSS